MNTTFGRALRIGLWVSTGEFVAIALGFGVLMLSPATYAQTRPTPRPAAAQSAPILPQPAVVAKTPAPEQQPMPQEAPPPQPEKPAPVTKCKVTYEAGELTIIAENASLSEIMSSLRTSTGADIDLPAGASRERIWASFGPGPARKVLASLLSETKLDYIIQASDVDPDGIRSVLLTTRTEGPPVSMAAAKAGSSTGRPLPQRASDSERRVVPNRPTGVPRIQEDAPLPESPVSTGAAPAATQSQPAPADSPSANPQPGAMDAVVAPDAQGSDANKAAASPSEGTAPQTSAPEASTTPAEAPAASAAPANTTNQMIRTLQDLYEQRKQMQLARTPQGQN